MSLVNNKIFPVFIFGALLAAVFTHTPGTIAQTVPEIRVPEVIIPEIPKLPEVKIPEVLPPVLMPLPKMLLPGVEISPERIKAQGVEISQEKITAPGLEISAEGIKTPIAEITPQEIKVNGGQIVVGLGGILIDAPEVKVKVGDSEVIVEKSGTKVMIGTGGISVETDESIKIDQNKISVITEKGEVQVNILPDDVVASPSIRGQQIEKMSLETTEGELRYEVSGKEKRRLFAIIPLSVSVKTSINAQTGEVEDKKAPWWRMFTI